MVRLAALGGADLITAPVNWPAMPVPPGERPADVVRVQAGAAVNGLFIAVADRCRAERGVSWVGGTVIVGPDGYPLAGRSRLTGRASWPWNAAWPGPGTSKSAHITMSSPTVGPALYGPVSADPATGVPGPVTSA